MRVNGSADASGTGTDQPVFHPFLEVGASPSASSSTTFDCSGEHVSFLAEDDQPSHAHTLDSQPTGTDTQTTLQRISAFTAPLIDAATSGLSQAAAVASGALRVAGAAVHELGNVPRSTLVSAATTFCGTAGALSLAAPLLIGRTQRSVGYSASAGWASVGAGMMVDAAGNGRNLASRLLQGTCGAANMAAAALAGASVTASAQGQSIKADTLQKVSAALLGVGAVTFVGALQAARLAAFNAPRRPDRESDGSV